MILPKSVRHRLAAASAADTSGAPRFTCSIFEGVWDQFVELWTPRIYVFIEQALGPYGKEPARQIQVMPEGYHAAGANASYSSWDGSVSLCQSVTQNRPGTTLEKLTHEFIHASLDGFPEGDPFVEEGFVDYSVWLMAHAPVWGEHRDAMLQAASYNIATRRDRAMMTGVEYDAKRWAGGLYASQRYGAYLIGVLKDKKSRGDLTWWG